uniref:Uncharacterized protein n=1 Tax=Knipowitschia caucasica TaxID=637954 RepID=A0AAV2MQ75_KNICA
MCPNLIQILFSVLVQTQALTWSDLCPSPVLQVQTEDSSRVAPGGYRTLIQQVGLAFEWDVKVQLNKSTIKALAHAVHKDLCYGRDKSSVRMAAQNDPSYKLEILECIRR